MLLEITIAPNDAGQRVERFLRRYLSHVGLSRLQALFRRREIKIARRPVERGRIVQAGEVLQVYGLRPEEAAGPPRESPVAPVPVRLPIVFEDEELLVIDKPAGWAAHPGTGIAPGESLIERVQAYLGTDANRGELFRPALVHRLDRETSGVILVAKTGVALRRLHAALREGKIRKRYLALVAGHPHPEAGVIDDPLERVDSAAGAKSRIAVADDENSKTAVTHYRVVKKAGTYALLQVIIATGRMHQIRAHLAHRGHPVAGDTRYERPAAARARRQALRLPRVFLHAEEISWRETQGRRVFRAPLPADLQAVVRWLENAAEAGAA